MRWTKGKPIAKAPLNTPILAATDPRRDDDGHKTYYRLVQRRQGPFVDDKPTYYCVSYPRGETLLHQPDRYWELPK